MMKTKRGMAWTVALALSLTLLATAAGVRAGEIGLVSVGSDEAVSVTGEVADDAAAAATLEGEAVTTDVTGESVAIDSAASSEVAELGADVQVSGDEAADAAQGSEAADGTQATEAATDSSSSPMASPRQMVVLAQQDSSLMDEQGSTVEVSYIDREFSTTAAAVQERPASCKATRYVGQLDLTGDYVVDHDVTVDKYPTTHGDVKLILCDGATLTCKDGIFIPEGSSLSIYGQEGDTGKIVSKPNSGPGIGSVGGKRGGMLFIHGGTIVAHGGSHGAGLGGANGGNGVFGEIAIYGGKVDARGGENSAGIGGGNSNEGERGPINIYGGEITAMGSQDGAGIGEGLKGEGGVIEIWGGSITAKGGRYASGIGGGNRKGDDGGHAGMISIFNGTVAADGGEDGAGIGGGEGGNAGEIVIAGGTITTHGGKRAAGIGCGECEHSGDGGTIDISGGTIKAYGGHSGAGIGGGEDGHSGRIRISGGDVRAESGHEAAGIGGGDAEPNEEVLITGGKVEAIAECDTLDHAGSNGAAIGGGNRGDGGKITITGGEVTATSFYGAGIGGGADNHNFWKCNPSGAGGDITISGGKVRAFAREGFGIGAGGCYNDCGADCFHSFSDLISSAGTITISGDADVYAEGGYGAIGGDSGTINIKGGHTRVETNVEVHKGDRGGIQLLSKNDAEINFTGGTLLASADDVSDQVKAAIYLRNADEDSVHIADGMSVSVGKHESDLKPVASDKRRKESISKSHNYVKVAPCEHAEGHYEMDEQTHTVCCPSCGSSEQSPHTTDGYGVCTVCGHESAKPDVSVSSSLDKRIGLDLHLGELPKDVDPADYAVWCWVGDDEERGHSATLADAVDGQLPLVGFAAKDTVTPTHVIVTRKGQKQAVSEMDYTLRDYCDRQIDEGKDALLAALCQSVLDYSTCAQLSLGDGMDDPANKNHAEGFAERLAAGCVPDAYLAQSTGACSLVSRVAASVSLESQAAVNFYITPVDGVSADKVKVMVDGERLYNRGTFDLGFATAKYQTLADGRIHVSLGGIATTALDHAFKIEIGSGDDTKTVSYSVLSYAYSKQSGSDKALADVCHSLYNYHKAAKAYAER